MDPLVPKLALADVTLGSLPLDIASAGLDARVIPSNHGGYDERLVRIFPLVFDSRNVPRGPKPTPGTRLVRL